MTSLAVTVQAERDLIDIWVSIARHNEAAAERMLARLDARMQPLVDHPMMDQARDDLRLGLRQLVEPPYLIFYRVLNAEALVEVVRVLHAARDLPETV